MSVGGRTGRAARTVARTARSIVRWVRRWIVRPASLPSLVLSIAVLLPAAALLTTVWLFGWQLQVVQTGSMSPTYPKGTLLVSEPTAPADVRPGDVLTFSAPWRDRALVTHRVRLIQTTEEGERLFVTRGDASDADDPSPLPEREARSVTRWGIPQLGTLLWWLRGWRGLGLLVVAPAVGLVLTEVRDRRLRRLPACAACGHRGHRAHGSVGQDADTPRTPIGQLTPVPPSPQ